MMNGAVFAMTSPPPPLPELGDLVERSEWLRGRAGLEAEVLRWHRSLGPERDRIVGEAEELATPRLRRIPFGALFLVIVRFLVGLLFLFASLAYFCHFGPQPKLEGGAKLFMEGMTAAVYFMPLLMTTELLCGIAFVSGRFVPLATVVIFPVSLNIVLFHVFLAREGLPIAVGLLLANVFLAYGCRQNYRGLLAAK